MEGIEFDDENNNYTGYRSRQILGNPVVPKSVEFLVNKNIVKSESAAYKILTVLIIIFFGLSFIIFFKDSIKKMFDDGPPELSLQQKYKIEQFNKKRSERGLPPIQQ